MSSSSALNPSARNYVPQAPSINTFPQLQTLQDELILVILSFVTDVPYESTTDQDKTGTLTHVLPLVNKKFQSMYTKSEYLWKKVLVRLVTDKQDLWGDAMIKFLYRPRTLSSSHNTNSNGTNSISSSSASANTNNVLHNHQQLVNEIDNDNQSNVIPLLSLSRTYFDGRGGEINAEKVVTDAGLFMEQLLEGHDGFFTTREPIQQQQQQQRTHFIFMELYRHVLCQYIKYTSPLFYMPDQVEIGREFGLQFFEPRYRLLIADVMEPFPKGFRRGGTITPLMSKLLCNLNQPFQRNSSPNPTFIYANRAPLKQDTVVTIVEVSHCTIHENGIADVYLNPVSYGRIEHVWQRPNSHHLYEAKVVRMDEAECDAFDQEANSRMYEQRRRFVELDSLVGGGGTGMEGFVGDGQNAHEYMAFFQQILQATNNVHAMNHAMYGDMDEEDEDDEDE